ncbi:hypothetical protein KC19_5G066500 [Ceratodon purpureus]|uniref:Bifunctional inhibitor/plant lipid transfer protein/seed storage helical domain-containing protein n=1 Tax=Ceratodon purpureus TaxID=3225 RepID=A0A8T0HZZ6_CERPU|nr:hypothetical protein KC19_5G066500 [Ceratodon purpureus]
MYRPQHCPSTPSSTEIDRASLSYDIHIRLSCSAYLRYLPAESVRAIEMEGSKVMAVAVCALLVLSLAGAAEAQCSMNQLSQCMGAVTRGTNPSPQCCRQVGAIADFNCFCRMVQSQRNIPQAYINNAVKVPGKCGAQGQKLRNRQCGSKPPKPFTCWMLWSY